MRWRRLLAGAAIIGAAGLVPVTGAWLWTRAAAAGHEHEVAAAPSADIVIVLGTEVAADRRSPSDRLAGRLQTAAALVHAGRASVILVSGDGSGTSGNEPAVMTDYLATLGIDRRQVVSDPYGLDTYDSCVRAHEVYGVSSALIVTQGYHLSRAVALCRHVGLAAEGVEASCPGCSSAMLATKAVRDVLACTKAAWDAARNRPPAVQSTLDPSVRDALGGQ